MSGRKETYVSVRDSELNRLRQQEARLRTIQSDLPDRLNSMRSEITREINQQSAIVERRIQQFQQTADKLRSEIADVEKRNQQQLQQGMRTLRQEYTELIKQEREARQHQIREVQSRISKLEQDANRLNQMAEAMLGDVNLLRQDVDTLPHERFAPGKMGKIITTINMADMNLRNGASQASLVDSQRAYVDLCELREEVLYKEREFFNEYYRVLEAVRALIEEVRANSSQMRLSRESGEDDMEVDIDFWSKGKLAELKARIQEIETALQNGREVLTLQQVHEYETRLEDLRAKVPEIVEEARLNIINSQACFNVAEVVAGVMREQGYDVDLVGTYQGEDQRGAYAVRVRNLGGDEVVSIVTPSAGNELGYSVQMNFFDRNKDETARGHFARSVYQALNNEGLQATPPRTTLPSGSENEEVRDLERFRQEKPQWQQAARPKAPGG